MRQLILQLDIVLGILLGWLRRSTLVEKARIDFPQALFEVSQPDNDDTDVDEREVGDDRENVDDELLSQLQVLDVDGIQPRLGAAAHSKEEGIDRSDVAKTGQDGEGQQGAANNVDVCVWSACCRRSRANASANLQCTEMKVR